MRIENNAAIKSAAGTVVKINIRFLQACLFGFLCGWLWPDSRFAFGWGFLAIVCGLIALVSFMSALKGIIQLRQRNQAIAEFAQLGAQPKSSTLADDDALNNAGMH